MASRGVLEDLMLLMEAGNLEGVRFPFALL